MLSERSESKHGGPRHYMQFGGRERFQNKCIAIDSPRKETIKHHLGRRMTAAVRSGVTMHGLYESPGIGKLFDMLSIG